MVILQKKINQEAELLCFTDKDLDRCLIAMMQVGHQVKFNLMQDIFNGLFLTTVSASDFKPHTVVWTFGTIDNQNSPALAIFFHPSLQFCFMLCFHLKVILLTSSTHIKALQLKYFVVSLMDFYSRGAEKVIYKENKNYKGNGGSFFVTTWQ